MSFWTPLWFGGDEVEGFPTLAQMKRAADAVVVARFTDFTRSRTIQGDAAEDVVVYAKASADIVKTISGKSYATPLSLEFIVNVPADEAEEFISRQARSLPRGDLLIFLRDKGGAESGLFRTVNSLGLWAATDRAPVDTPLREMSPDDAGVYSNELDGVDSIEELNSRMESM